MAEITPGQGQKDMSRDDILRKVGAPLDPRPAVDAAPTPDTPPAETAAAGSAPRTYTVQSGDTLSGIAAQYYGDAKEYPKIFEANRDKLDDPDLIHPGQELVIPE